MHLGCRAAEGSHTGPQLASESALQLWSGGRPVTLELGWGGDAGCWSASLQTQAGVSQGVSLLAQAEDRQPCFRQHHASRIDPSHTRGGVAQIERHDRGPCMAGGCLSMPCTAGKDGRVQ